MLERLCYVTFSLRFIILYYEPSNLVTNIICSLQTLSVECSLRRIKNTFILLSIKCDISCMYVVFRITDFLRSSCSNCVAMMLVCVLVFDS